MSQSLGNYIGIEEPPDEVFGKLMSVPDHLIAKYELLCTDLGPDRQRAGESRTRRRLAPSERREAADGPRDRRPLPRRGGGRGGRGTLRGRLQGPRDPLEVQEVELPSDVLRDGMVWLPKVLVSAGLASSNGEARRAIEQGGFRLDGEPVTDPDAELAPGALVGAVLQVGRRRFVRIASLG